MQENCYTSFSQLIKANWGIEPKTPASIASALSAMTINRLKVVSRTGLLGSGWGSGLKLTKILGLIQV